MKYYSYWEYEDDKLGNGYGFKAFDSLAEYKKWNEQDRKEALANVNIVYEENGSQAAAYKYNFAFPKDLLEALDIFPEDIEKTRAFMFGELNIEE